MSDRFYQLLNEINLIDDKPLITAIHNALDQKGVDDRRIREWFLTKFVKWYKSPINTYPGDNERYYPQQNDPQWMHDNWVYTFTQFSGGRLQWISHAIDYMLSLDDRERSKLSRISMDQLKDRMEQWDEQLKNQKNTQQESIEGQDYRVVHQFGSGMKMVELISPREYTREGELMGHCVGSYYENDIVDIYSLRDAKNLPHVTIEAQGDCVWQIKGKGNESPVDRYIPYVKTFIIQHNFNVKGDGENIGMIFHHSQYFFIDSPQFRHVHKTQIQPEIDKFFDRFKAHVENNVLDLNSLFGHDDGYHDDGWGLKFITHFPKWFSQLDRVIGHVFLEQFLGDTLHGLPSIKGTLRIMDPAKLTDLRGIKNTTRVICFKCSKLNSLNGLQNSNAREIRILLSPRIQSMEFLPPSVKQLSIQNCSLKSLAGCPDRVEFLEVSNNQLQSLHGLPRGCYYCYATNNQIQTLDGAQFVEALYVDHNPLVDITGVSPDKILSLYIRHTQVRDLSPLQSQRPIAVKARGTPINLDSCPPNVELNHDDLNLDLK